MKRLVICIVIITGIIAAGICSAAVVGERNERLYGHVQSVLAAYEAGDGEEEIESLEKFFREDYAPRLSVIVNDGQLADLWTSVAKLKPMLESGCDEFSAECEAIKAGAERIYRGELPGIWRLL